MREQAAREKKLAEEWSRREAAERKKMFDQEKKRLEEERRRMEREEAEERRKQESARLRELAAEKLRMEDEKRRRWILCVPEHGVCKCALKFRNHLSLLLIQSLCLRNHLLKHGTALDPCRRPCK